MLDSVMEWPGLDWFDSNVGVWAHGGCWVLHSVPLDPTAISTRSMHACIFEKYAKSTFYPKGAPGGFAPGRKIWHKASTPFINKV
jgi:hypothetical protein